MFNTVTELVSLVDQAYIYGEKQEHILQAQRRFGNYGDRIFNDFSNRFAYAKFNNRTDWNYSTCFSFEFTMQNEEALSGRVPSDELISYVKKVGEVDVFSFDISALGPIYRANKFTYSYRKLADPALFVKFGLWNLQDPLILEIFNGIVELGYEYVSDQLLSHAVDGIALELAGRDNCTLYSCLFHDGTERFIDVDGVEQRWS